MIGGSMRGMPGGNASFAFGVKAMQGYDGVSFGKTWTGKYVRDIDLGNVVVTDNRVVMVAKDGTIALEIVRNVEYAKAIVASLRGKSAIDLCVDKAKYGHGIYLYNSSSKSGGLFGGGSVNLELRTFLDWKSAAAVKSGALGAVQSAPALNQFATSGKVQLSLKPEGDKSKVEGILALLGNGNAALIEYASTYSSKKELLRNDN